MKLFKGKKAQGATEYLLMLAAVLVIVAVAIYYIRGAAPTATITGSAEASGNDVIFTPSATMTPKTIAAADWSWAVYHDGTEIGSGTGTTVGKALERGLPVTLTCTSAPVSGDKVKIKYKDTWYDAATVA